MSVFFFFYWCHGSVSKSFICIPPYCKASAAFFPSWVVCGSPSIKVHMQTSSFPNELSKWIKGVQLTCADVTLRCCSAPRSAYWENCLFSSLIFSWLSRVKLNLVWASKSRRFLLVPIIMPLDAGMLSACGPGTTHLEMHAHTLTHRVWSTVIKATLVGFALAKISPETFALIKCHVKRQIWSVSTHHLGSMFSFVNVLSYCNENTARHGILQRLNRDVQ